MDGLEDQLRFDGANLVMGKQGETQSYDARFLISTLLIYVAKGDGGISELESGRMVELLSSKMHIRGGEALEHLSTAIMALSNDKDIVKRLQDVGRGLSSTEKDEVFTMMLDVTMVDGIQDAGEIEAIKLAGQILGLSQDAIHASLRSVATDN
jgi:uncharacterized tellurite resistance protein B-like protein